MAGKAWRIGLMGHGAVVRNVDLLLSALDDEAKRYAGRAMVILLPILAAVAVAYVVWRRRRARPPGSA